MNSIFWTRLHGGSAQFPVGLLAASFIFDIAAHLIRREPHTHDLHAAGYYALLLGAISSFIAVFSGLALSDWQLIGGGDLAKHHFFLWPAFVLLIGLAVWRLVVQDRASRLAFTLYLYVAAIAVVLIAVAEYWGGAIVQRG